MKSANHRCRILKAEKTYSTSSPFITLVFNMYLYLEAINVLLKYLHYCCSNKDLKGCCCESGIQFLYGGLFEIISTVHFCLNFFKSFFHKVIKFHIYVQVLCCKAKSTLFKNIPSLYHQSDKIVHILFRAMKSTTRQIR